MVTGQVVGQVGTGVQGVGNVVSDIGTALVTVPVVGTVGSGLVTNTGNAVTSVGTGLTNGLGSLGTNKDSLGLTVAGATTAVSDIGKGVTSVGTGVSTVLDNTLISQIPIVGGVTNKVTDVAGGLVGKVGTSVTMLGNTLTGSTTTGPLSNVTGAVNDKVLVPVISMVETTTGKVGTTTGLGAPVDGVLNKVSTVVGGLGDKVAATGNNPVTSVVGGVLDTVAGVSDKAGGLVNPAVGTGGGAGGSGGLAGSGLLETVGGVVNGVGAAAIQAQGQTIDCAPGAVGEAVRQADSERQGHLVASRIGHAAGIVQGRSALQGHLEGRAGPQVDGLVAEQPLGFASALQPGLPATLGVRVARGVRPAGLRRAGYGRRPARNRVRQGCR